MRAKLPPPAPGSSSFLSTRVGFIDYFLSKICCFSASILDIRLAGGSGPPSFWPGALGGALGVALVSSAAFGSFFLSPDAARAIYSAKLSYGFGGGGGGFLTIGSIEINEPSCILEGSIMRECSNIPPSPPLNIDWLAVSKISFSKSNSSPI
jgi:hypothetical protein